jgi:hypothetical protein
VTRHSDATASAEIHGDRTARKDGTVRHDTTALERVGNMTDREFAQLVSDVVTTAQPFEEIDARESANPTSLPSALQALSEPEARA